MNSMTGYGKAVTEKDGRKITVELKSVNHRFLDISFKLPKLLNFLEDEIRQGLRAEFHRGHIDAYVTYENNRADGVKLTLNEGVADEYTRIKNLLLEKYGVVDDYSVTSMLKTPDLVSAQTAEEDEQALTLLLKEALAGAIAQLKRMRSFEGAKISADILVKVAEIERIVGEVKKLAPTAVESYRTRLTERVTEALANVQLDEARLLNEVAFFTDKAAVDEEITRLSSHCQHLREMVASTVPAGKNMDFLMQEFNREANTIGSKCNDLAITGEVLKLKNEIEKIREQVQNVE